MKETTISESTFDTDFASSMTLEKFLLSSPSELYYDEDKFQFKEEE